MSFPDSIVTMRHYLPRRGLRVGYDYCWVRCRRQVTSWLDINKYTKIVVNSVSCDLTPRCCDNGVAVIYICSGKHLANVCRHRCQNSYVQKCCVPNSIKDQRVS